MGQRPFYFRVGVVTDCLSVCSTICTSDKQSDKRTIAPSTRKLTNCPSNCLRPLASLLKTKCFFCFFMAPHGATKCAFQRFEIPFFVFACASVRNIQCPIPRCVNIRWWQSTAFFLCKTMIEPIRRWELAARQRKVRRAGRQRHTHARNHPRQDRHAPPNRLDVDTRRVVNSARESFPRSARSSRKNAAEEECA